MRINPKIFRTISSPGFFKFTLAFFLFESLWIAFSASYPQAFDENFHYGLIQIYSHGLSPFLSHQPPNAGAYGAVASDPSYLYHYIMSFPLRLISLFTHSLTVKIISLRVIDVALFGSGLILFKRVLRESGVNEVRANLFIFLFVLIPIVPMLAGQINYDDLLFPLVALTTLLCFRLAGQFKQGAFSSSTLFLLISVCMLTSLVTYAYLPIFLGVVIFIIWLIKLNFGMKLKNAFTSLKRDYLARPVKLKLLISIVLLLSLVLFLQRYGMNIVRYHSL